MSRRFAQQSSQSDFLLASLYARDDPRRALAHLSRALRSNPENHAAETLGWSLSLSIPFSIAAFQHEAEVNSASFSADGTRVVTASGDKTARVWDVAFDQSAAPAWVSSLFDQITEQHIGDEAILQYFDRRLKIGSEEAINEAFVAILLF